MSYEGLAEVSKRMNGPHLNGAGRSWRQAAHHVVEREPGLLEEDYFSELKGTLETPRNGTYDEFLQATKAVRDAASSLPGSWAEAVALSELNPEWVIEQLEAGATDTVLAVAGVMRRARDLAKSVHQVAVEVSASAD
jgi:hypothetical protein